MKKLYYLIVAIIGVIVFLQCQKKEIETNTLNEDELKVEARSTGLGQSCLEPQPFPCQSGTYTWNIQIPDYPECVFNVSVNYYACLGTYANRLHLGDFRDSIIVGCESFTSDWRWAVLNGTEQQFITNFNQQVWHVVTQSLLNTSPVSTWGVAVFEYNIGACKYLCNFDILDCGETCCQKTNLWLRNLKGEWYLAQEGEIVSIGSCPSQPTQTCPPNAIQSSECFDNCASLEF